MHRYLLYLHEGQQGQLLAQVGVRVKQMFDLFIIEVLPTVTITVLR